MNEFLQTLNQTNPDRLIWYGIFILAFVTIIVEGAVKIYKRNHKYKKEIEKDLQKPY